MHKLRPGAASPLEAHAFDIAAPAPLLKRAADWFRHEGRLVMRLRALKFLGIPHQRRPSLIGQVAGYTGHLVIDAEMPNDE